jgi:hypothetical protein
MTRYAFVALVLSGISLAHAEVLELEGTVKAVDATARTMSVERKTPKGTKTLELEVNKKAGDLSSVKVGDRITFSYDPDLELVTKLGAEAAKQEEAKDTDRIVRVRYHFAADGTCKLETVRLKSKAEPVTGGYKKEEKGNGVWQITETFEDKDSLERFSGQISDLMNVTYSTERKALKLSPKAGGKSKAVLMYPKRVRLPLTVEADISTADEHGHFQINPNAAMPPNLHPFANVFTHDGGNKLDLSCSWVVSRDAKKGEPTVEEVFGERGVSTNVPFSKDARPPVGTDPEMIYFINLGAFDAGPDSCTVYVSRLSVTARFAPLLGLAIKQVNAGDPLLAAAVAKNSPAEKAGLKEGDVVTAVDGKSPGTLIRALQLLSMTNYGESWNLEVERDGQKKTFSIKAE